MCKGMENAGDSDEGGGAGTVRRDGEGCPA